MAYVVEGHASACPQTVGVATLCGVVMRTLRGRRGWVVMVTVKKVKLNFLEVTNMFYIIYLYFLLAKKTKIVMKIIGSYPTLNPNVS